MLSLASSIWDEAKARGMEITMATVSIIKILKDQLKATLWLGPRYADGISTPTGTWRQAHDEAAGGTLTSSASFSVSSLFS